MTDTDHDTTNQIGTKVPRPTAAKGLIFLVIVAVVAALLAVFVLQQRSVDGPLVLTEEPAPLPVMTERVALQASFEIDERFSGLVVPRRSSQLGFAAGGRIADIRVDTGDKVESGDVLARLDTRALRAQLSAAEASIAEAEASYALALTTVDRQVTLNQKGHVSAQRVDEAVAQAATSKARIEAAAANADMLRVQIDLASVTAPFSGTITHRMSDEGAIASPGAPLFELVESRVLEVEIGLPEAVAATLMEGTAYTLLAGDEPVEAVLKATTAIIDQGSRTVTTVFEGLDPDQVAAGEVVRIALRQQVEQHGAWVPVTALSESQRGLWSVYTAQSVDQGWEAVPGKVEILHTEGERAFVRGTLRDGDQLILDGLQRITPGQKIVPSASGAASSLANKG